MKEVINNFKKFYQAKINWKMISIFVVIASVFLSITFFNLYFQRRIFPGIYISSIYVGGLNKQEAINLLSNSTTTPSAITLTMKDKVFDLSLSEVGFYYDFDKTVNHAFYTYRDKQGFNNYPDRFLSFINNRNLDLITTFDETKLNEYIQVVSQQVAVEPIDPSVTFEKESVVIDKGTAGETIDVEPFKKTLYKNLSQKNFLPIEIPIKSINTTLSDEEADNLRKRAEIFVSKNIVLKFENDVIIDNKESTIFSFLDPNNLFDESQILNFIKKDVSPKLNRESQNAVFQFESGKVVEFIPAKDGVTVNEQALIDKIVEGLKILEKSDEKTVFIDIPVNTAPPSITTAEVNNLGIKELLGKGTSKFAGSIPGRIHNISLASSKFVGILVPPDTIFSFNDTLGDVSVFTGYKQAYIIKDGKTVLGDGGGVCQVSTTLFRALLDAGLPIVERRAHSYRVGYYEQGSPVGLDATVFAPTTDLKFKNDTPSHLLIQTQFDAKNSTLVFEIYGTSDGRVATTTKPIITSSVAPPEDLYIDDPTLPTGTVKQIDYKAWGARVVFDHKVERNGEIIYQNTFVSNYRPWQAKFLRGTGPVVLN